MNPQDALALQIGRHMLDLAIAQQTIATQAQRIQALEARLAEHETEREQERV